MNRHGRYRFGPFVLDTKSKVLFRDGVPVPLSKLHIALLQELVENPGVTVSVARLRDVLNAALAAEAATCLPEGDTGLETVFAWYRDRDLAHAAVETFRLEEVTGARAQLASLVLSPLRDCESMVWLAQACLLHFEATRRDASPDLDSLQGALDWAHEACKSSRASPDAWATLALVQHRLGLRDETVTSVWRALSDLSPDWRTFTLCAAATWGSNRLSKAYEALAVLPGAPVPHALAATVLVARGDLAAAEAEIDTGMKLAIAMQIWAQSPGVHWLKGLLCAARGDPRAVHYLECELRTTTIDHVYGREVHAESWYAIGGCRLGLGDRGGARTAFEQCLALVPSHRMARAGSQILERQDLVGPARSRSPLNALWFDIPMPVDEAAAAAARLVAHGDLASAVALVSRALAVAPPGDAGWWIPIDPLLAVQRAPEAWRPVCRALRARAE